MPTAPLALKMTTDQLENLELQRIAMAAAQTLDATADKLLATTHHAYKAWCRARRLHFPPDKRQGFLLEVLRYCIDEGITSEKLRSIEARSRDIASMLDARHPRYARNLAR